VEERGMSQMSSSRLLPAVFFGHGNPMNALEVNRYSQAWRAYGQAKLAVLRERGVLVVASGNVVHNLRGLSRHMTDDGYDWAKRFDRPPRR
jgi:aromatic ring-opening dioxygenase catalytic subunit (LigB family)